MNVSLYPLNVANVTSIKMEIGEFRVFSLITAWKVSKYGVFSGPYFPVFGLESVFLYSFRTQENTDQKKLRIWTLFTQWIRILIFNV